MRHFQAPRVLLPLLLPIVALWAGSMLHAQPRTIQTGTYGIEGAKDLEERGLSHFLYLHPSGRFMMAAEWPHNESSRAAGHWRLDGAEVTLTGFAHVETNQGTWDVPFRRVFREETFADKTRLVPLPEKNRFGMLGWPNAYAFKSAQPTPSLAIGGIPTDEGRLIAMIDEFISRQRQAAPR